jgi:hypothetical protein
MILQNVIATETGYILTNTNNEINASNIATDGTSIFINTYGKYRTSSLIYGSKINGLLELHSPIKYNTTSQAYSDYSGIIPYDNYGTYPVDTPFFLLQGYESSYIKTTNYEYMIQKFNTFGYDDIKLYYKNATVGWTQIVVPFTSYTSAGSGKFNLFLGHTKIGNDDYIGFSYSVGANQLYSIFNLSGSTTMQLISNTTFAFGSVNLNTMYTLRKSSPTSTYLIFGKYKINVTAHTYTDISPNCVYSQAYYDTTSDVIYEVCNNVLYRSSLSGGNITLNSIDMSGFASCSSLNSLNPELKNIHCINSTSCLLGGRYLFNTDYYSYLLYVSGTTCTDVFSNNLNDTINAQVSSITNIGSTFYYGGINIFGYYGYNPAINTTNPSICLNANTMCTNPVRFLGEYQCYSGDVVNCAQGCTGSGNTIVCTNNCATNTLNSCNILGATSCYDSTTIAKCDNWGGQGCLTYSPTTNCPVGQFCLNSGSFLATCVNTTQNGTHSVYGLTVLPYSTSESGNVTYLDNPTTRTVQVSTSYAIHRQDFYTQGTNYMSRTCDYSEPVLLSTGFALVQNYGNDSVQYLPSASNVDTIIKLSITPSNYSEGWIHITDTLGNLDSRFYYQRNSSAKRMTIYDNSLNVIYSDFSTNSFDDLRSVDFEYSFNFVTKTYTVKTSFVRAVTNIVVFGAQTFLGSNIYKINVSQFINNSDTIINQLVVTQPTPYTTFTSNTLGTTVIQIENPNCNCGVITCQEFRNVRGQQAYFDLCLINQTIPIFKLPCDYSTTGAHFVRTYGNNDGVPDYSTYADYTVVINGLGLTSGEVDNANPNNFVSGGGLPEYMRWIIVALTIMILVGAFIVIGYQTESPKMSMIIGAVLSVFAILIYTLIGWISAWILVAIVVFSLAIVIIFGSMKTSAGGV